MGCGLAIVLEGGQNRWVAYVCHQCTEEKHDAGLHCHVRVIPQSCLCLAVGTMVDAGPMESTH
jgi:hypothetical protein